MKKKKRAVLIFFTIIFTVLWLTLILFERFFIPIVREALLIFPGLSFFALLFYSGRRNAKSDNENVKLTLKLDDLITVSNRVYNSFFDFYKNINQFYTLLDNNNSGRESIDGLPEINDTGGIKTGISPLENAGAAISRSEKLIGIIEKENDNILLYSQDTSLKTEAKMYNKNMMLGFKYYSDIIYEFMSSIIKNFNDSTEPLSTGIYNIKLKTSDFLTHVTSWNDDLKDEKSDKNFNRIIFKYDRQSDEFKSIFHQIDDNYLTLENNLNSIMLKFKTLLENTDAINEISENIRILSINASLESVRAGIYGKGFKIVADEVKKLSGTTQAYVKKIIPMIKETNTMIDSALKNFESGSKNVVKKINNQKTEFDIFYSILTNYYNDFNKIFSFIASLIQDVNLNIDNLVPIFHLSNLSMQEMENLNKMVSLFMSKYETDIANHIQTMTFEEKKIVLESLIQSFRKETTTEKELDVINRIFVKLGFEKIDLKKTKTDVELF